MIISRINDGIGIRTRNPETLEREEKTVSFKEFPPYFFIKKDSP